MAAKSSKGGVYDVENSAVIHEVFLTEQRYWAAKDITRVNSPDKEQSLVYFRLIQSADLDPFVWDGAIRASASSLELMRKSPCEAASRLTSKWTCLSSTIN